MSIGHFGWIKTPDEQLRVVEDLMNQTQGGLKFKDLAPHLKDLGKGKLSVPFKAARHFDPDCFEDEAQGTGDCTSHGTRNAIQISNAAEILFHKEPERYVGRFATEPIYGYRGHGGQGMNPGRATEFVTKYGVIPRIKFGTYDLSSYNWRLGHGWGRTGVPSEVREEASKHPCTYHCLIESVEEARDALAAGYGLHVGSQYGNDGTRDSNGVARWNASWNHDMAVGACDDTGKEPYFLILNSWGVWNRGGHPEWGPIPGGSFLVPASDFDRMIRGGECWAIGLVHGWPVLDLPDFGTDTFL